MHSTNFKKICCSFAENKIFEISKMADISFCARTVAIATVLNQNLIVVAKSNYLIESCLHAKA